MIGALDGKVVAVLGASGCHGAAAARALAAEGASLVLGARSREPLEELQRELDGTNVLVVGTDVTRRHHPERLVEVAVESLGGLDALIYAARARPIPLTSPEVEGWEGVFDVNVRGLVYALGAALAVMEERGGHIVDLGSAPGAGDHLGRGAAAAKREVAESFEPKFSDKVITFSEAGGAEELLDALAGREP